MVADVTVGACVVSTSGVALVSVSGVALVACCVVLGSVDVGANVVVCRRLHTSQ